MKLVHSLALVCATIALAGAAGAQDKPARSSSKGPTPVQGAQTVLPTLSAADQEQLLAASQAYYGPYDCEFKQTVNVGLNPKNDGYLDVKFGKSVWTMKPVLSTTGALRLEDVKGRMLMLQIANKSMLMDTKMGQRVVDGCVHEKQRNFVPQPDAEGIGIDPAKAASAPAAKT